MRTGILITGALGGLGHALVEAAAQLKDIDCIVAADNKEEILTKYISDPGVVGIFMDVSSQKSIEEARNTIHDRGITVKYLINSAGIARFFPISEADEARLDAIVKVNTYGPVLTVSAFLSDLVQNKGRVIQISSDNVRLSGLFQPYATTKIALESFSIAMRQELGLFNVDLVLIRPGAINTGLLHAVASAEIPDTNSIYKEYFQKFTGIAQKEVGRTVEPSKVARLVMKALAVKKPKRIYSINKNAKISFLAKFPQRWIDYLVRKSILSG
jgi:NAD(P)-dependent dehydrogenase (short-subunit alcohol dehydrogenase family)